MIEMLIAILRFVALLLWRADELMRSNIRSEPLCLPVRLWPFANHPPSSWAVP